MISLALFLWPISGWLIVGFKFNRAGFFRVCDWWGWSDVVRTFIVALFVGAFAGPFNLVAAAAIDLDDVP